MALTQPMFAASARRTSSKRTSTPSSPSAPSQSCRLRPHASRPSKLHTPQASNTRTSGAYRAANREGSLASTAAAYSIISASPALASISLMTLPLGYFHPADDEFEDERSATAASVLA